MSTIVISTDEEMARKIGEAIAKIKAEEPEEEWTEEDEREHQEYVAEMRAKRLREAEFDKKSIGWFVAVMERRDRWMGQDDVDVELIEALERGEKARGET